MRHWIIVLVVLGACGEAVEGAEAVPDAATGGADVAPVDVVSTDLGPTPGAGATLCDGVTCAPLDACHVAGVCDPTTGECTNPTLPDGSPCSDGDECTRVDRCSAGVCAGSEPVVCPPSGPCVVVGECVPATGICATTPKDGDCDDGNACTATDRCLGGFCVGDDAKVCPPANACELPGVCNPVTGECSVNLQDDGSACDDGDACTQTDVCVDGSCVGKNPVDCLEPNPCLRPGVCIPETGLCSGSTLNDAAICDDQNPCTLGDACVGGACVGTVLVECPSAGPCFLPAACDLLTGACAEPLPADGAPCDDGDACTTTDLCDTGECVGAEPLECVAIDACHSPGICDPDSGACTTPVAPDGTDCDDGQACTLGDRCLAGACTPEAPVLCGAPSPCHSVGQCDPATGACVEPAAANGTDCDDDNPCTVGESCQSGACLGGAPVVCAASDACHLPGTCDPLTGACDSPPRPDGASCSDGNACTNVDVCLAGVCTSGAPVACAPAGPCRSAGVCNPVSGACFAVDLPDGTPCGDGDACTTGDSCASGACVGGVPVVCAAPGPCERTGQCDPATGACDYSAFDDGVTCDDGNACTAGDKCTAGDCVGAAKACSALDACHVPGLCNPANGACSNPLAPTGTPCDDGDDCTTVDVCLSGSCVGSGCVGSVLFEEPFDSSCSGGCPADGFVGKSTVWTVVAIGTNGFCPNDFFVSSAEAGGDEGDCGSSGDDASLHVANQACSPTAPFFCPGGDCGAAYDAGCDSLSCAFGLCSCSTPGGGVVSSRTARSGPIDATGWSNLVVTFNYIEGGQGVSDDASFEWFDGALWNGVVLPKTQKCGGQGQWTKFTVTLPAAANDNPSLRIGFRWVNNGDGMGADPSFAVDDIIIDGQ